ncbi:hypothetical protein GXB85_00385 [Cellulomonas sp. APG4]|nr:hypothetical protein [Cellulomonas sp. APG4]NCT89414.1 hypothetical protein [Cellulomonas sp. APG4]
MDEKATPQRYLRTQPDGGVREVEGLGEYAARRPHHARIEAGARAAG